MHSLSAAAARALLDALPEPIILFDAAGLVVSSNAAARAADWLASAPLAGVDIAELFPDGESHVRTRNAFGQARQGHASRYALSLAEPSNRSLEVDVVPLSPEALGEAAVLMAPRDVTPHVQRANALETDLEARTAALTTIAGQLLEESRRLVAARRQISQSEKVKLFGQFVGQIVHDMNNVLAVMRATFDLARRRARDSLPPALFEDGQQAIDRGVDLVRQLLTFARGNDTAPESVVVPNLLAENQQLLQHLVGDVAVVDIDAPPDVWPLLLRPGSLQSVIFNLVANARDAMAIQPGGRITLRARNRAEGTQPDALMARDYVHLAVQDEGAGMPPEVLARVGQPFFTTKEKGKGTGLGLASAFDLAAGVGGAVLIDSSPGCGTQVNLWLPRAGAYELDGEAVDAIADRPLHGNATVLVVEADEGVRITLADFLRTLHYTVLEAASAEIALVHRLAPLRIDLLVVSADLPERPGQDLVRDFRDGQPDLPVVLLEAKGSRRGIDGAVTLRKPIYEPMLARILLEELGRLPARVLTAERLASAERLRDRLRDSAMRDAFDHWCKVSSAYRRLPALADLPDLAHRFRDYGYLAAVEYVADEPVGFRVERFGHDLRERLGRDLTGAVLGPDTESDLGSARQAWQRCSTGLPYYDYARFRLADRTTRFDRLLLPLSEDGHRVTHLFGAVLFEDTLTPAAIGRGP